MKRLKPEIFRANRPIEIGVPDYDNYVEHMRVTSGPVPMTYEEFFRGAVMRYGERWREVLLIFAGWR